MAITPAANTVLKSGFTEINVHNLTANDFFFSFPSNNTHQYLLIRPLLLSYEHVGEKWTL